MAVAEEEAAEEAAEEGEVVEEGEEAVAEAGVWGAGVGVGECPQGALAARGAVAVHEPDRARSRTNWASTWPCECSVRAG